jgi:thiamine-monophosphate kinase
VLATVPRPLQHECLLAGGDDYELLFTAPAAAHAEVRAAGTAAGVAVHCCGRIESAAGLRIVDGTGRAVATPWRAFDHFA